MNIIKEIEGEPKICIIVSDGELDVVNCGCRAIMVRPCARMYVGSGGSGVIHAYLDHVLANPHARRRVRGGGLYPRCHYIQIYVMCLLLVGQEAERLEGGSLRELCRVAVVSTYCRESLIYGGAMGDVWDACNSTRRNVCAVENSYVFCINGITWKIIKRRRRRGGGGGRGGGKVFYILILVVSLH